MISRPRPGALLAVVALLVACFTGPAAAEEAPAPTTASCIPADQCCKVCDAGQACGNTCISRAKVCHKGHGCACDAAALCP